MKLLRQFGFILAVGYTGEIIQKVFGLPLPGSVIGMLILFFLLNIKVITLEQIKEVSDFLLKHLPFFFVPAGVGLLTYIGIIKENWVSILAISVITTIVVAAVTGGVIQFLKRGVKE